MDQLTFLSEEHPANHSALQDLEAEWQTTVATWPSNSADLLLGKGPLGSSGRTSPVCCRQTKDGTLVPSSGRWQNAGMGSPTEFLTLSLSEWNHTLLPSPNAGGVCSLSDVLEVGNVPQRYYLSAKACKGILRRAENRGKVLPEQLAAALKAVVDSEPTSS